MLHFLLGLLLTSLATFLILVILVQRGRGGGLSGALGGMGGQSAFGTKAGDAFTKITIGISIAWIVMCIITSLVLGRGAKSAFDTGEPDTTVTVPSTELGTETDLPDASSATPDDNAAEVATEGGVAAGVEPDAGDGEPSNQ